MLQLTYDLLYFEVADSEYITQENQKSNLTSRIYNYIYVTLKLVRR